MNELQQPADRLAIGLSVLCAFHCLALPLLAALLPAAIGLQLESEALHLWMVVGVLPISLYALTIGCKKHRKLSVAAAGIFGLVLLIAAIATGMLGFGEVVEKSLTMAGATLIAIAHFWNYRLCQHDNHSCDCH
jgi:hypothetical protein